MLGSVVNNFSGQDIKESVYLTLDSDSSELRNFLYLCQNEATVDVHGYVLPCPVAQTPRGVYAIWVLHNRVGLCVARSQR